MAYTFSASNPIFDPLLFLQIPPYVEFYNPYAFRRYASPLYCHVSDFIENELGRDGRRRDKEADGDNLIGRTGSLRRGAASPILREYSDWR